MKRDLLNPSPLSPGGVPGPGQIRNPKSEIRNRRGFTLVELLLVVTIIGVLAAIVVPKMMGRSEQARQVATRADIASVKTALDAFEVDNGYYPKGTGGLEDLLQQPRDARNWRGPYLDKVPQDPWGNVYVYTCPGKHNVNSYDLMSAGQDGQAGTDDDIGNWTVK